MLVCMKQHDVSEWVSSLEELHGGLRATVSEGSDEATKASLRRAMAALERLHERMLRAEIRTMFAERAAGRGDG